MNRLRSGAAQAIASGEVVATEDPGVYCLKGATPGTLTLHLEADGFVPRDRVEILVPNEADKSVILEMEPGAELTLQLRPTGTLTEIADRLRFWVEAGAVRTFDQGLEQCQRVLAHEHQAARASGVHIEPIVACAA